MSVPQAKEGQVLNLSSALVPTAGKRTCEKEGEGRDDYRWRSELRHDSC